VHCDKCKTLLEPGKIHCTTCDTDQVTSNKSTYYHVPMKYAMLDLFRDEVLVSLMEYGPRVLRHHAAKVARGEQVEYGDVWTGDCLQKLGKNHFFDKVKVCYMCCSFHTNHSIESNQFGPKLTDRWRSIK